jgi:hypothetical protein
MFTPGENVDTAKVQKSQSGRMKTNMVDSHVGGRFQDQEKTKLKMLIVRRTYKNDLDVMTFKI